MVLGRRSRAGCVGRRLSALPRPSQPATSFSVRTTGSTRSDCTHRRLDQARAVAVAAADERQRDGWRAPMNGWRGLAAATRLAVGRDAARSTSRTMARSSCSVIAIESTCVDDADDRGVDRRAPSCRAPRPPRVLRARPAPSRARRRRRRRPPAAPSPRGVSSRFSGCTSSSFAPSNLRCFCVETTVPTTRAICIDHHASAIHRIGHPTSQ